MKKQLVIIGIVAILVTVGLSGCNSTEKTNENNNDSSKAYEEKIIGLWLGTNLGPNITSTFTFYTNRSCYFTWNELTKWATYSITDKTLTLISIADGVSTPYEYFISDNNNTLTIFGTTEYGENAVYTKH